MTCGELIAYLNQFDPEDVVGLGAIDVIRRLRYRVVACQAVTDQAILLLDINEVGTLGDFTGEEKP